MGEQPKDQTPDTAPRKRGFQPGHPKYGGRQKGVGNWNARTLAEQHKFNPFLVLMNAAVLGTMPPPGGVGEPVKLKPEERLKAARACIPYLYPAMSAVQVTGVDGGPVAVAEFDVTELMKDPKLAEAAQTLALGMVEQERAQRDPANWPDDPEPVSGEVITDED